VVVLLVLSKLRLPFFLSFSLSFAHQKFCPQNLGLPLKFILTPGQRNDCTQAIELTEQISGVTVIADKGYDSDAIIQQLAHQDCAAVIPPKRNRKIPRIIDRYLYKERHVIECCFGKLKHYRRIFSRFEKSASAFMSFLCFAGTLLWLR